MKNIKSLILIAALTSVSMFAGTAVGSNKSAGRTEAVFTGPTVMQTVSLWSTNTVPTIVRLYDGNIVWTNAAYTNVTVYTTNLVSTYTNSVGTTNTFTNTTVYSSMAVVAANTNNASTPIVTLVCPANNVPITFDAPLTIGRFLTLSNDQTGLSYVITYRTQ